MDIEELTDNFELLDNWEDRYRYIIELGEQLEPFSDGFRTEEWKVKGCQSQVWLVPQKRDGKIYFIGDSDAMIVKGLIAITLMIYSGKTAAEIKALDVEPIFSRLKLQEHLSPSRRNGLLAMTDKIRFYAGIL